MKHFTRRLFNTNLKQDLYRKLVADRRWMSSFYRAYTYDWREFVGERLATRNDREMLEKVRAGRDVCWTEGDELEPLVSIVIPTFRRPDAIRRAVDAARAQTYERVEIIVVGDHTDEQSAEIVTGIDDDRVRFFNLPYQGLYPDAGTARWQVAGATPMNVGIDLASGAWIANCDDDDELLPKHVEVLLGDAKRRRLEMIYGRFEAVERDGDASVEIGGSEPLQRGAVARGTVLYSLGLRFMKYNTQSWRIREPADWNLWKRMQMAGVKIGFNETVTYRYYR